MTPEARDTLINALNYLPYRSRGDIDAKCILDGIIVSYDESLIPPSFDYPKKVLHFKGRYNVEFYDYNLCYNGNGRPLYLHCEFCGNPAVQIMASTGTMSGARFEQNLCDRHLSEFKTGQPITITDRRIAEKEYDAVVRQMYEERSKV